MKTYYWKREIRGLISEGKFSILRRVFDRVIFRAKYTIIGEWRDDL